MRIITLALGLILAGCNPGSNVQHPSDIQLIEDFQHHEADFNKLVNMANEDAKVVRITNDFTWLDNNMSWPRPKAELGFSTQRWDEYRGLFKQLNLAAGINRREEIPDAIFFIASSEGAFLRGTEKGYAYLRKEPALLVDSLDRIDFQVKSKVPVYKKIKSNWYLYYEVGG